jgi:hypothetical protein
MQMRFINTLRAISTQTHLGAQMQEPNEIIYELPDDIIERVVNNLSFSDINHFLGSCHTLFNMSGLLKKNMRKAYIEEFLTEDPQLIQDLSQEEVFAKLQQEFIIPFEKAFFKISQPTALEGASKGYALCLKNGFEKLYLQLQKSCQWAAYSNRSGDTDFHKFINNRLCDVLSWEIQIDKIRNYKNPASMLWAMATQIHPSLYFTGLSAALILGRVDLFDKLLNKFDIIYSIYDKTNCDFDASQYGPMPLLLLENIKQWAFRFKHEYDDFVIPNYAEWGCCEALFELSLAKQAEKDSNHPLHFLWACYTADSKEILHYFKNKPFLIEEMYHPQDFKESKLSTECRRIHPEIEKMQESALSLYARNVNPEDKQIITILLDNPVVSTRMHNRDAYKQTPLQIAMKNKKSQLVMAMLDKTDEMALTSHYNEKEIADIYKAMDSYLNEKHQDNNTLRI